MAGLLAAFFGGTSSQQLASNNTPRAPSYDFSRLQQLYDRLSQFKESDLEKGGGGDDVVETVRQITEALIWGEQNDTNFFDFFCEKSILADFIRVIGLQKAPKKVKVQLLQTLSMLVQNVRRKTSVFYLLSNNYVNKLIGTPLDFNDEEILAYYITLLKSLAMRLDTETIKFFFLQYPEPVFPLYIEATKFFSHKDQMVRATVRTITLQVYRIEDRAMRSFVLRHAAESYFSQLAFHLRDLWLRFDAAVASASEEDLGAVMHDNELQQDLLIYLSDVFELGVTELNDVLADRLLNCVLLPVLLAGVASSRGPTQTINNDREVRVLSPAVALFFLRQVIDVFRCPVLVAPLAAMLLEPMVSAGLLYALAIADEASPVAGLPHGDQVPNPVRDSFLRFLRGSDNANFLLAAAVVHACVQNRRALTAAFFQSARIFAPPSEDEALMAGQHCLQRHSSNSYPGPGDPGTSSPDMWRVAHETGSPASSTPQIHRSSSSRGPGASAVVDADQQIEVTLLLMQALQRHAVWNLDTLQGLHRIVLDLILHTSVCHHARTQTLVARALQSALRTAAQRLRCFIQDGIAKNSDDSVLDVLMEEWVVHTAVPVNITELCSNPRRFLLSASPSRPSVAGRGRGSARPSFSGLDGAKTMQKAVRCYFLIRRLLKDFSTFGPQVPRAPPPDHFSHLSSPWIAPSKEVPLLVIDDEEAQAFKEGMSFEIGRTERIVCGIAAPNGKHTRYLVLHDFFFVLVQPDLASPGWCVVRTLWPLQQVQSLIDRSDPRTLQVGMHSYQPGNSPGEAVCGSAQQPLGDHGEEKVGAYYTLTLNFEDFRRCHAADVHLQRRRTEVRASLMRKAVNFVEQSLH